ncbi:NnrS family protein [Sinorhizobium meliloti]|uniref:NnrS family protein n=1 Tax=Rhizobium meliloti TaxID=382 RepID=UPI000FD57FCB|nr:NnrS family protein [Sinorhizobium meliloti]MDE3822868.1 NnrS family protein [Sinorhizobium meliloti]QGJ76972.1 short-chain dehydrogenase [Sinorhizobium meliloti]QND30294.1 short-chain dehydrogenase [Sinorhizobium meliloti]RVE95323.1 short-chain dehydrogenase [Sinorhizobium meliloti]RVG01798.1 short-chain dehydrogenase [Sinorhizobium meliloti]
MSGSKVAKREGYVPRGLARTGPVLFSYGFRPFFLGAAVWAVVAMTLWIAALAGHLEVAGSYGAHAWHAHEMLFGFAPAVLAGFLLTAVPNWTGRLPVSGWPLAGLFTLWLAGRAALLSPDLIGIPPAATIDGLFLPALLLICAREVIAGRKWKDLKVLGGLLALSLANACFHSAVVTGDHVHIAMRLGISAYVALVTIIGGRILPSFTRNWLNRAGRTEFPVPYNHFDTVAILAGIAALGAWTLVPDHPVTAVPAFAAALLHTVRLARWRGWRTWPEMLLVILHVAYAFVPLGFAAIGIGALGFVEELSVMHVLTVGAIAAMMLAVMTRASLGHTGYPLTASRLTAASYAAVVLSALLRPLAEMLPEIAPTLYAVSGSAWILAFALFCIEYGPILVRKRRAVQ